MDTLGTPVLDQVTNESGLCGGFPADTYNRYVLGLLDANERANVDRELGRQCPACLAGIQRSINLWLVFAGSLQQVEPAADFRARLIRIAELSNRVLTVPKHYKQRKPAILFSSLFISCLILALLLFVTFLAGQQSSRSELKKVKGDLVSLQEEAVERQAALKDSSDKTAGLKTSPNQPASDANKAISEQLSKAQADIAKYQAVIQSYADSVDRDQLRRSENSTLVGVLENPGVHLLSFKTPEGAASAAYAFVIENARILFFASNMQPPSDQHRYQLWLIRKTDRRALSLGLFDVKRGQPAIVSYDEDKDAVADLAGLLVTEETVDGSAEPSATKVIETTGAAPAAAPGVGDSY